MINPAAIVEIWRGDAIESRHEVDVVLASTDGVIDAWGEATRPVIARSAIKSIQALPLLTTGAAERFDVSNDELALACASHSGEPEHTAAVEAWLHRLGLSADDLECGADEPIGLAAQQAFHRAGSVKTALLNCCSGKHTGFLTIARHLDVDTAGYIAADHPVQELVAEAIGVMTGAAVTPVGVDGCGIPVHGIPADRLAAAMARLASPTGLDPAIVAAANTLTGLLPSRAFWVSGTDRFEHKLEQVALEPVVAKTGAEGVFMGAFPDRGVGFALKARDGTRRAAEAALDALLSHLHITTAPVTTGELVNKAGKVSGRTVARLA